MASFTNSLTLFNDPLMENQGQDLKGELSVACKIMHEKVAMNLRGLVFMWKICFLVV